MGVAVLDRREDLGHFGHGGRSSQPIRTYYGHRPRSAVAPAHPVRDRLDCGRPRFQDKPAGQDLIGGRGVALRASRVTPSLGGEASITLTDSPTQPFAARVKKRIDCGWKRAFSDLDAKAPEY